MASAWATWIGVLLALAPAVAAADPHIKIEVLAAGDDGVIVKNSPFAQVNVERHEHITVVHSSDYYLALAVLQTHERNRAADAAKIRDLQRALARARQRGSSADAELVAELAAQRAALDAMLAAHAKFRDEVAKELVALGDLASIARAIPPAQASSLNAALAEADLDAATAAYGYIKFERSHGGHRYRAHVGLASVGDGDPRDGGTAGYFRLTWPLVGYAGRSLGVGIGGGASFTIGAAELADDRRFFLDYSMHIGPWLRVGGPTNLLIETFFDPPLYMYASGESSFPLLGAGGRIALSHEPTSIGVFYRRAFTGAFGDGPDVTSVGVSISYIDSNRTGNELSRMRQRSDAAWGGMFGVLSHTTFPSGGIAAGARLRTHKTYYPNSRTFGVGVTTALSALLGQLDRDGDKVFASSAGFATGPHVRFGRSGWFKLEAHLAMELFGYTDGDWKFFLPGIGGELGLGWLSVVYRHVHASWRDDALGDYNLLLLAFNKRFAIDDGD